MDTKHTPGPWTTAQADGSMVHIGPIVYSQADGHIADISYQGAPCGSTAIANANARLVAAAPELAEALDRVYQFLYENYKDSDMPDILPMVRAALAKAGL